VTAKFLVVPSKATRNVVVAECDITVSRVEELERLEIVEQNTNSRWASAPHIVPRSYADGSRLTVDLRQVNQRTEPIVWPMTDVESCSHRLAASAC
jgi:hypothetical protein